MVYGDSELAALDALKATSDCDYDRVLGTDRRPTWNSGLGILGNTGVICNTSYKGLQGTTWAQPSVFTASWPTSSGVDDAGALSPTSPFGGAVAWRHKTVPVGRHASQTQSRNETWC